MPLVYALSVFHRITHSLTEALPSGKTKTCKNTSSIESAQIKRSGMKMILHFLIIMQERNTLEK